MKKNLIMFNNVTLVIKSKEILKRNKINAKLIRTPSGVRNKSCGYSLLVNQNFDLAIDILGRFQIPILGTAVVDLL